jgi:hypothetical protein
VLLLLAPWVGPAVHAGRLLTFTATSLAEVRHPVPFANSAAAGRYLAEHTAPQEPVLVLGSEPEIYYYAQRPAACRMAIYYPMTGPYSYSAALCDEFLAQWQRQPPRYVAALCVPSSYSEYSERAQNFCLQAAPVLDRQYVLEASFPPAPKTAAGASDAQPLILIFRRNARQ